MAAQFRNLPIEADPGKTGRDTRSESGTHACFTPHRVPKNLANLFLGAATMTVRATLELLLHIVIELADENLRH
jgi:hypothetical protein